MDRSAYVKYNSPIYGKGAGQIMDVLEKEGKTIVLVEPLYNDKDRRNNEHTEPVIVLELKEVNVCSEIEIGKRMRYR